MEDIKALDCSDCNLSYELEWHVDKNNFDDVVADLYKFELIKTPYYDSNKLDDNEFVDICVCSDGIVLMFCCKWLNKRDSIALPRSITMEQIKLAIPPAFFLDIIFDQFKQLRDYPGRRASI